MILGTTGCGKTQVMKRIRIPAHRRRGEKVIVLDPLEQPGWGADFQTADPGEFLAVAKASRRCVLVIDEWPYLQDNYGYDEWRPLVWSYTVARNYGHLAYAMGQTQMWIPKSVRRQCPAGIIFQMLDPADCLEVSRILGCPAMATLPMSLPLGSGFLVHPGNQYQLFKLFDPLPTRMLKSQGKPVNGVPARVG